MRQALFAAAIFLSAHAAAQQQPDWSNTEIRVERVAPGVAVLFGRGGNIGLSYGVDGNLLIDDQYAPLTERILAAVRSVDPDPIRFVVNTHWHGDHTGGKRMSAAPARSSSPTTTSAAACPWTRSSAARRCRHRRPAPCR